MAAHKARRFWRIVGNLGTTQIHDQTVPIGEFSDAAMEHLLRALAARAGLDFSDIVNAYAKRHTRRFSPLLEVRHAGFPYITLSCGNNPYFTATVVDAEGRPIKHERP